MTTRDEYERAISPLRDGPLALRDPAEGVPQRERMLAHMRVLVADAPRRLRSRRRRRQAYAVFGIAAAVMLVWFGSRGHAALSPNPAGSDTLLVEMTGTHHATWLDGNAETKLVGPRARVPNRGKLSSLDATDVTMLMPDGVNVSLGSRTEVALGEVALVQGRSVIDLKRGRVRCSVPPLAPNRSFSVRARDLEVVVHGTVFSVTAAEDTSDSCVRVERGRVEVRRAGHSLAMLEAGGSYGCDSVTAPKSLVSAEPAAVAPPPVARHAPVEHRSRPVSGEQPSGTLGEESRLLAAALVAERSGDMVSARDQFTAFVARYPHSPLSAEARAGLARTRNALKRP